MRFHSLHWAYTAYIDNTPPQSEATLSIRHLLFGRLQWLSIACRVVDNCLNHSKDTSRNRICTYTLFQLEKMLLATKLNAPLYVTLSVYSVHIQQLRGRIGATVRLLLTWKETWDSGYKAEKDYFVSRKGWRYSIANGYRCFNEHCTPGMNSLKYFVLAITMADILILQCILF